jgi:hypothetical protein
MAKILFIAPKKNDKILGLSLFFWYLSLGYMQKVDKWRAPKKKRRKGW